MRSWQRPGAALAALLLLAGCSAVRPDTRPASAAPDQTAATQSAPAPGSTAPGAHPAGLADLKPDDVAYVADIPPLPPGDEMARPLFPGRPEDRPWIEMLLRGLATAQPADPAGADGEHRRVAWLQIKLRNGREILIRDAWNCTSTGGGTSCQTVPGKLVIAEGDQRQVVTSAELTAFLHTNKETAMPRVNRYRFEPETIQPGGTLKVWGDGWASTGNYRIILERLGVKRTLAEGPLTLGAYRWEGQLPADLVSGDYQLDVEVDGGGMIGKTLKILP